MHRNLGNLDQYLGLYRGLSPTDESPITSGEIEIVVGKESLKIRHATGIEVLEETASLDQLRELSEEEVTQQIDDDPDAYRSFIGFQTGEDGIILLFWRDPKKEKMTFIGRLVTNLLSSLKPKEYDVSLIVRLSALSEMLGPTMLYNEDQVSNGAFDHLIKDITNEAGEYVFPRLKYDGKCSP